MSRHKTKKPPLTSDVLNHWLLEVAGFKTFSIEIFLPTFSGETESLQLESDFIEGRNVYILQFLHQTNNNIAEFALSS